MEYFDDLLHNDDFNLQDDEWVEVDSKQVEDSDGFLTDYTWYTNGKKHIFMFGDKDIYTPNEDYADWEVEIYDGMEAEARKEAQEWFDGYNGFGDDDLDESTKQGERDVKILGGMFEFVEGSHPAISQKIGRLMDIDKINSIMESEHFDLNLRDEPGYDKCYVDIIVEVDGKKYKFHGARFDLGGSGGVTITDDDLEWLKDKYKNVPEEDLGEPLDESVNESIGKDFSVKLRDVKGNEFWVSVVAENEEDAKRYTQKIDYDKYHTHEIPTAIEVRERVVTEAMKENMNEDTYRVSTKADDIEFIMNNYIKKDIGVKNLIKKSKLKYIVVLDDGRKAEIKFDDSSSEWVYYINGKGPFSHSSYEYILTDIDNVLYSDDYDSKRKEAFDKLSGALKSMAEVHFDLGYGKLNIKEFEEQIDKNTAIEGYRNVANAHIIDMYKIYSDHFDSIASKNESLKEDMIKEDTNTQNKWEKIFDEYLDLIEFRLEKDEKGHFHLHDLQGANLGGIEQESFDNAEQILDRLEVYHIDYIVNDLENAISDSGIESDGIKGNEFSDILKYRDKLPSYSWDFDVLDMIVNHVEDINLENVHYEDYIGYDFDTDESLNESIKKRYALTDDTDEVIQIVNSKKEAFDWVKENPRIKFIEVVDYISDQDGEDYDWGSAEVIWERDEEMNESAKYGFENISVVVRSTKEDGSDVFVDQIFFDTPKEAKDFARSVNSGENDTYINCYAKVIRDVDIDESKKLNESHSIVDKVNSFRKKYPKAVWFDNGKEVIIRETKENERRLKEFGLLDYAVLDTYYLHDSDNGYDIYVIDYSTEYDTLSAKNFDKELSEDFMFQEFTDKEAKEIVNWWKEVEKWNSENGNQFNIDNGDYSDIEGLHSAMFDMLKDIKDKNIDLYKKGKRIYNKKAMSKIRESKLNEDSEQYPIEELDRLCKEYLNTISYLDRLDDGTFEYKIYPYYRDAIEPKQAYDMLKKGLSTDSFYDEVDGWYDYYDDPYSGIRRGFEDYLNDKGFDIDVDELSDEIWEVINDNVSIYADYDFYLDQEFKSHIIVDTGDANYEFSLNPNDSIYAGENHNLEEEDTLNYSSLVWLVKQQGHTVEELKDALENGTDNKFLKSVCDEIYNATSSLNCLVFLCEATLKQLMSFTPECTITINKCYSCGLFDAVNGGGSILEIELEKPVVIPGNYVGEFTIDEGSRYGYGVDDVYGLTRKAYEADITITCPNGEKITESVVANKTQMDEINNICKRIGIETISDLEHFKKEMGCENCSTDKLIELLREYEKELGDDFKIEESADQRTITISDLRKNHPWSHSVKDNSVRGFHTADIDDVKVGDEVIINNHFTKVVGDDKIGESVDENLKKLKESKMRNKKPLSNHNLLKESMSDEDANKLYDLYNNGEIFFNIADGEDGEMFLIIEGWKELQKLQSELRPDFVPKDEYDTSVIDELFGNNWGFSDEYTTCDNCRKVIRTSPDSYSWVSDYFADYNNGAVYCSDCVRENDEILQDYLESLSNNPKHANTILSDSELSAEGFVKVSDEDGYESGYYDRNDDPEKILKDAMEEYPEADFIFSITGNGQFNTTYDLWAKGVKDLNSNVEESVECKGSINIRESLNKIDNDNYNQYDLRNLYDSQILSEDRKVELAKLLKENKDAKEIYSFLTEGLFEEDEFKGEEEIEEERGEAFFIRKPKSLEDIKNVKEERMTVDPDSVGDDYSVLKTIDSENIQSLGALNSIAEKYSELFDENDDNYFDHYVIKVRTPDGDWLIDTNGYDYARYVAFIGKE